MAEITDGIQLFPYPLGTYTNADPVQIPRSTAQKILNGDLIGTRDNPGGVVTRPGLKFQNEENPIGVDTSGERVIFHTEYWANITDEKQQRFVAVTEDRNVFADTFGGTWPTQLNDSSVTLNNFSEGQITAEVMNNDLVMGFRNSDSGVLVWENQHTSTLLVPLSSTTGFSGTTSGNFFEGIKRCYILRQHQNRMFYAGDPQNPDRLNFSKAGVYNQFDVVGTNSAGFIDVFPGDNDPEGITSIFPSINAQELYVAKRTKLYKIITSATDTNNWAVIKVSDEIGCVNHNTAKTIDQKDVYFESDLGVHSLLQVISGTQVLEGTLISFPITRDFRDKLDLAAKSFHSAVYDATNNQYLLAVRLEGSNDFDRIYVYDIENRGWTIRETSADAEFNFISKRFNKASGQTEVYVGGNNGFIYQFDPALTTDLGSFSIALEVQTAQIFPNNRSFLTESNFTDCFVLARVSGDTTLSLAYRIDNQAIINESTSIDSAGGNRLGSTILGALPIGAPYVLGIGRGIRPFPFKLQSVGYSGEFTFRHDDLNQKLELYGIIIKYNNSEESRRSQGFGSI